MPYIFYLNTHSCKYACGCSVCDLRLIIQVIEVWSKFCFVSPVKFVKSHLRPSGSKPSMFFFPPTFVVYIEKVSMDVSLDLSRNVLHTKKKGIF